ncbi:MAG: hypothetical protein GY815_12970 [Gammaproteobacteria bacterium]|nr:hypothetical protein [Gammaproteobacteria bacterium]
MEIRDATFNDLEFILPIMHQVHAESIFKGIEVNEATIQRNFVVAMSFDDGYAKVVEHKGKIVGALVGIIMDNHFGIRCAQDLFSYAGAGTDRLLKDFLLWAEVRGVRFVQITDLSDSSRFQKLCQLIGLESIGVNFVKVV